MRSRLGTLLGLAAGIGSVVLPAQLGLENSATDRTLETQALAIGMYTAGGMAAGAAYRLMR